MKHLSEEELLALAEGRKPSEMDRSHLSACSLCSREFAGLRGLLSSVEAIEEPSVRPEVLERISDGVTQGISRLTWAGPRLVHRRTRKRAVAWAAAAALPLAAAALLFLLPRQGDFSPVGFHGLQSASIVDDLSRNELDYVWQGLTQEMKELELLARAVEANHQSFEEIRDMSSSELESFLNLLESYRFGSQDKNDSFSWRLYPFGENGAGFTTMAALEESPSIYRSKLGNNRTRGLQSVSPHSKC